MANMFSRVVKIGALLSAINSAKPPESSAAPESSQLETISAPTRGGFLHISKVTGMLDRLVQHQLILPAEHDSLQHEVQQFYRRLDSPSDNPDTPRDLHDRKLLGGIFTLDHFGRISEKLVTQGFISSKEVAELHLRPYQNRVDGAGECLQRYFREYAKGRQIFPIEF